MRLSMVPARNLLRRHCGTYGGAFCFGGGDGYDTHHFDDIKKSSSSFCSLRTSSMAGEPSRTVTNTPEVEDDDDEVGTSDSSSKNWLQLGLTATTPTPPPLAAAPADRRERMLELELFSDRPSPSSAATAIASRSYDTCAIARPDIAAIPPPPIGMPMSMPTTPTMLPPPAAYGLSCYRREMPLPFGVWNPNLIIGSSSSMVPPSPPALPEFMARQLMYSPGGFGSTPSAASGGVAGMRAISPPRRQQTGVWFLLQAAENQGREPFLPQIPRSYLRIKDGRMTVRLLIKYLVNKLGLEDESEVEMTCRGQLLLPFLTLQHVRDNIWRLREQMTLFMDSPTTDHIMTLQYSRRA